MKVYMVSYSNNSGYGIAAIFIDKEKSIKYANDFQTKCPAMTIQVAEYTIEDGEEFLGMEKGE